MQWQSNSLSAPDHYIRGGGGGGISDQKHVEAEDLNLADMIRFRSLLFYCCIVCNMDRNINCRGEVVIYTEYVQHI